MSFIAGNATASAPATRSGCKDHTILVVEDHAEVREFIIKLFHELGYQTLEATNGADALTVVRAERVDLVFTDILLPGGLNGFQVGLMAQAIRPGLKVVYTTGHMTETAKMSQHDAHIIMKPYRPLQLAREIANVLHGS